ncbi:acyltransferase [Pollutibacter soli]|uniref:acyltransferase n=1 Tax=Pollutibacter soli TaxID=3034157 RepID=UPI003013950D
MLKKLGYFLRKPFFLPVYLFTKWNPRFQFLFNTRDYIVKVNFGFWFVQKVLNIGGNKLAYWPVHWTSTVHDPEHIIVGVDSYPGYNGGAYITGIGGIYIGNYCIFAKNIVMVTANHSNYDYRERVIEPIHMGDYCWMGAGSKIMPGVSVGDHTIIAAGAVVTKSFPEGYCILAGIPARKIKELDPAKCVNYEHTNKYRGYIAEKDFDSYRKKRLKK